VTSSLPRKCSTTELRQLLTPLNKEEKFIERETGLEPATNSLEGCDSSQLSYSRLLCISKFLRTQILVIAKHRTIMVLNDLNIFFSLAAWKTNEVRTQKGSIFSFNSFKMVGREGIEPPKA
jgi:hypothetical protein